MGGLRHPAYTLARTPLGRLLIAVGRAAPLSVAWLPLAGFLLPSSPLPQVAEAVGAGEVIGGSWSSILFSLDVAVGLWPLLAERKYKRKYHHIQIPVICLSTITGTGRSTTEAAIETERPSSCGLAQIKSVATDTKQSKWIFDGRCGRV
eukprot:COSAG02_NODE_12805_length_1489_cov_2.190647_2_plen_149_part_00